MNKLKILLYLIPLVTASIGGFYVNGGYYLIGFRSLGYGVISLALAIVIMIFEFVLWLYTSKKPTIILLKIFMIATSVFITLTAQSASTFQIETEARNEVQNTDLILQEIEGYENQLSEATERLNTYLELQKDQGAWGYTTAVENTQNTITELNKQLNLSREKLKSVESFEVAKTAFDWYAEKLGFENSGAEDIRNGFQLFLAVLLAIIAPVCLSLIREVLKTKEEKVRIEKPEIKKELNKLQILGEKATNNILTMLLYDYPEKPIQKPEKASKNFVNVNKKNKSIPPYSVEDCKRVYGEIYANNLDTESKEIIFKKIQGVLNE